LLLYPFANSFAFRTSRASGDWPSLNTLPSGVGQLAMSMRRSRFPFESCTTPSFETPAVGVDQDEQSSSAVRGSQVFRSETHPLRIEPENGKVGEDGVESHSNVVCDVLKEGESPDCRKLELLDDPEDVGPDMPFVFDAAPATCLGEGLAGITSNDASHSSTPRSTVESGNVSPDRRLIHERCIHRRCQTGAAECISLNVADCASCRQREFETDVDAVPSTGAE
jgi:hypothetical protein